ncbi:hypothetical protein FN846DRAFT_886406 [Sphaerosporella brunnea]|uniref:Uncharacterized protein n=1 Tax=Sphaerosporella brunnea TaxID=1250544 RepID=A0A5J5F9X1_9PEZI|nr:hypothetical protein FN846DRAFT_886406 [Sphaerosporella brunnea]
MGLISVPHQRRSPVTPRWGMLEVRNDASDSVLCEQVLKKYWVVCSTGFRGCCESISCRACETLGPIDLGSASTSTSAASTVSTVTPTTVLNTVTSERSTTIPPTTTPTQPGATTNTIISISTSNGVPVTKTLLQTSTVTATSIADSSNTDSSSNIGLPVGVAGGVVLVIALLIAFFLFRRKRKQRQQQTENPMGKAATPTNPNTPNGNHGFFKTFKKRISVGLGSPPPAYVEEDRDKTLPGVTELPGDTEHVAELSSEGWVMTVPTELPSPPLREGAGGAGNSGGHGLGLWGGGIQEMDHNARREDVPSAADSTTTSELQSKESGAGPSKYSSAGQEGWEQNGVGMSSGTPALGQKGTGSHVMSFMQYEGEGVEGTNRC